MAEDDKSDRHFSRSSRCWMHARLTYTLFPLCGNSSAGFARKEKHRDSRFLSPLARPNTIFDVIIEAHDAATVNDGNQTKTGIRSKGGIIQQQGVAEDFTAAHNGSTAQEIITGGKSGCNAERKRAGVSFIIHIDRIIHLIGIG